MSNAVRIREPRAEDEGVWRRLWAGYLAFYHADIPTEVTDQTWSRILQGTCGTFGQFATMEGTVVGFAVCVIHDGTWSTEPTCYLEDLFVAPAERDEVSGERCWTNSWHSAANGAGVRFIGTLAPSTHPQEFGHPQ